MTIAAKNNQTCAPWAQVRSAASPPASGFGTCRVDVRDTAGAAGLVVESSRRSQLAPLGSGSNPTVINRIRRAIRNARCKLTPAEVQNDHRRDRVWTRGPLWHLTRDCPRTWALVTPLEQRPDLLPYGIQNNLHGSLGEVATKWGRPVKGQLLSWGDKENAST